MTRFGAKACLSVCLANELSRECESHISHKTLLELKLYRVHFSKKKKILRTINKLARIIIVGSAYCQFVAVFCIRIEY